VLLVAALLTECSSSPSKASPSSCGVSSSAPCPDGALVPADGAGCLGTLCPSGQVCGIQGSSASCLLGTLPCGWAQLSTDVQLVVGIVCTTDAECPSTATCSGGICFGTVCPSGQVCSGLSFDAMCGPEPEGGVAEASVVVEASVAEASLAEASVADGSVEAAAAVDSSALDSSEDAPADTASETGAPLDAGANADGAEASAED